MQEDMVNNNIRIDVASTYFRESKIIKASPVANEENSRRCSLGICTIFWQDQFFPYILELIEKFCYPS